MRDPRGIMNSRLPNWCSDNPHCNNVTQLCLQMEQDLASATKFSFKQTLKISCPKFQRLFCVGGCSIKNLCISLTHKERLRELDFISTDEKKILKSTFLDEVPTSETD